MRITHFFILLFILLFFNCKHEKTVLTKIEGKRIEINDSLKADPEIETFIKPYREHIERDLDSVLAYAVDTYNKDDGELNTAIGNLFTEIVYQQANPIFKKKTGNDIDIVGLNHGGIRAEIPKGPVTARTAYNVMPFENSIVVVGLKGEQVNEMISYFVKRRRAHPIKGLKIVLDKDYNLVEAKVKNEAIDTNRIYYVATSDYLYNRGDNMSFFQPNESLINLDYKIRSAIIDYFKKVDTINPVRDDRFSIRN